MTKLYISAQQPDITIDKSTKLVTLVDIFIPAHADKQVVEKENKKFKIQRLTKMSGRDYGK